MNDFLAGMLFGGLVMFIVYLCIEPAVNQQNILCSEIDWKSPACAEIKAERLKSVGLVP